MKILPPLRCFRQLFRMSEVWTLPAVPVVHCLIVLDDQNNTIPVAWHLTESASSIHMLLEALMKTARDISPSFTFGCALCDDDPCRAIGNQADFHLGILLEYLLEIVPESDCTQCS